MTEKLDIICQLITDLSEKVKRDLRSRNTPTTAAQGVMLYWFAKAAKTYSAIVLLWREGYWQDAAALARTLLEIAFQSKYLSEDPGPRAELFLKHDKRQRVKFLRVADKYNDGIDTDIQDHIHAIEDDTVVKQRWRNWWGEKQDISRLAELAGLSPAYELQYAFLSIFIHSASPGISSYIYGSGDTVRVDWKANPPAPEKTGVAKTLIAGAATYIMDMISALAIVYGFEYESDLQTAKDAIEEFRKS
jgi:hypothetical protein